MDRPSFVSTCTKTAVLAGVGLAAGWALWPGQVLHATALAALVGATVLMTALDRWRARLDRAAMPPSFVIELTALLVLGPRAMALVAGAGAVAVGLPVAPRPRAIAGALVNIVTVVAAAEASAYVHAALGGSTGHFIWPWQGAPVLAAVLVYALVRSGASDLVLPLVNGQPVAPWPKSTMRLVPSAVIGGAVAVVAAEIVGHRAWELVPVAAVPLYLAYRAYDDYEDRIEGEHRSRRLMDVLDSPLAVVDDLGRVVGWNDAIVRLLSCPAERALGRLLIDVVPALRQTALPDALEDLLRGQWSKPIGPAFKVALEARLLQITIVPDVRGALLTWQDVTEQARSEQALKRRADRLALIADGATDGLWEWDLRTNELYLSARWRAVVGLPPEESAGRREDWFDRVHADDLTSLKEALAAHLTGQIDHFRHEHRLRHEDGTYRSVLCRGVAVRGANQKPARIAGSMTDIAGATAQERARSMRFRDPLTGLNNRAVFADGLGRKLNELKKSRGARFAVLYLDLDRFKVVNDSLGHLVGDELLTAVSRRLESCLRPGDMLARLGGDEFAILLSGLGDEMQANAIALRIQTALGAPFSIGDREVFTSASIGIAFSRPEYINPEEIMRDADTAMYQAKVNGKARHELFDAEMHASALDRLGLESDLRRAVQNHAFEVHYQPIVSLPTGRCTGFESLVRWKRNGTAVSPARFIPIAEELGLIESLGKWVLQQACRTFADWQQRFPDNRLDCITVNVSTRQLVQRGFLQLVKQVVHESGLRPSDLRLEITETALMEGPALAAQVLRDLRTFGVKIYLDDFGTGYSSLSHLHKLPVDALKIDRSFVRSLLLDDRPAIVESILALARTLHTGVVAEGVESEVQARELERLGCRQAQGYFYSPPLPVAAVEAMLATGEPLGSSQRGEPSRLAAAS